MKKVLNKILFIGVGSVFAPMAFASGVGGRLQSFMDDLGILGDFIYVVAFIVGILLFFNGLMKIKAWSDNPQQNPILKPLIYAIVGALMMGLTAYVTLVSETVVGEGPTNTVENMSKF